MPSAQDCAQRLREQAYRTLLPQIRDLEQQLQGFSSALSDGIQQIGRRLDALRNIELPTTEVVLGEILGEVKLQKDLETNALVLFAQDLRRKETQEEILTLLLEAAHKYVPRVALFAVRGDRFAGWSSRGYAEDQARKISTCSFFRSECAPLEKALESDGPVTMPGFAEDQGPLALLQEQAAGPWHLMPLRALQRPVALLLADGNESAPSSRDALCVLTELASLQLENTALKILYELTSAKPATAPQPLRAEEAAAPEPSAEPELPPVMPAVPQEPVPVPALEESAPAAPEAKADQEFVEPPPAGPVPAPEVTPALEPEAPPPEPAKVWPQEPYPVGDEEKLHQDARRFARLLVTEIKLYNEHHVVEGRENRDLYLRLKRDIDRSREMYEKRVSPHVARKIDYFHDEIIRILGDNDPSTLGSDYPGPRAES